MQLSGSRAGHLCKKVRRIDKLVACAVERRPEVLGEMSDLHATGVETIRGPWSVKCAMGSMSPVSILPASKTHVLCRAVRSNERMATRPSPMTLTIIRQNNTASVCASSALMHDDLLPCLLVSVTSLAWCTSRYPYILPSSTASRLSPPRYTV